MNALVSIAVAVFACSAVCAEPCVVAEGENWVRFEHRNDIVPGSALDFSEMRLQDAPAGRHGWLKAKGGHFEFENLPGVEQRFYGVNLCFSANFPDRDLADCVADRLVRCGYNTVRIHHYDGMWAKSEANREKLDYFVAKCIERGIYITTDLYVSRPVKWQRNAYKRMVGTNDVAFCDWADFARSFLEHVNPHTGQVYKDEPAMPLISLVNEGGESRAVWEKCSAFVRALGAKALLTNDNHGTKHGDGEGLTPMYDYVDNHFYVDHPDFIGRQWQLPSRCDNKNPILTKKPWLFHVGYAKGASKPYTITEWNFSGPGRYRGMGGLLTGAQAAEQEWDGLWRFAYSHSARDLADVPEGAPGYFDCATDPLIAASDRASVCLFLRRDVVAGSLRMDKAAGSMTLVSPRMCGGFAESGTIDAGPLSFTICTNAVAHRIVPTTLWVSSIDGKPVAESSRMLLTHLTDVQGAGATFEDATRKVLLNWGKGCLVESGAAEVSLCINEPHCYHIWALAANGARRFAVPCRVEKDILRFSVATRGVDGKGVMQYEITR